MWICTALYKIHIQKNTKIEEYSLHTRPITAQSHHSAQINNLHLKAQKAHEFNISPTASKESSDKKSFKHHLKGNRNSPKPTAISL